MLRLRPSQISLTHGDVKDYKARSDYRSAVRLMWFPASSSTMHSYHSSTLPKIQKGAQRFRDDALVHASMPHNASSASSDSLRDQNSSHIAVADGQSNRTAPIVYQNIKSRDRPRCRRDSVLSHEEGIYVNVKQEQNAPRARLGSTAVSSRSLEAGDRERQHDSSSSPRNSSSSKPNIDSVSDVGDLQIPAGLGHTPNAIPGEHRGKLNRRPACHRRFRPRSFSDPCDSSLPNLNLERARRSLNEPRGTTASPLKTSADHGELAYDSCIPEVNPVFEGGLSSGLANAVNFECPEAIHRRYMTTTDDTHTRHRSLSPPLPVEFNTQKNGNLKLRSLHATDWEKSDLSRERSATLEAQRDRASPLESLGDDVREYSRQQWMASLPVRPRQDANEDNFRLSAFESAEIPSSAVIDTSLQSSDAATHLSRGPRSSLYLTFPSSNSSALRHPYSVEMMERVQSPQRRPVAWDLGQSLPTEFGVVTGGRPSFGWLRQEHDQRATRRRLVPNVEQENEDGLEQYEEERRARQRRIEAAAGGVLDRTPPRQGRLERYLR